MAVRISIIILITGVLLSLCNTACAQKVLGPEDLTDVHIQKAIDALVDALYARKDAQRFWELTKIPPNESKTQGGGYTALSVLALLHAGQSYQDPRLRDAIDFLSQYKMEGTYAVAMRASVWAMLPTKFHDNLIADARWLMQGFSVKNGGWDYVQNPTSKYHDNSIRQFGALALWEAAKRDVKIDRRFWQRLEDAYISSQLPNGGWNYKGDGPPTGSMTAAGLATLFITQDMLHADEAVNLRRPDHDRSQKAIDRGMAWMDANFSATQNPGKDAHFAYYMYGVERVGLASGYQSFGGHDWFREGAAELIRRLCKWDPDEQTFSMKAATDRASATDDIAFALLFLSRGRVPVAVNKLEFAGSWNNRPRDVANLTRWIAENSESELNWQIVNMNSSPQQWLDAPLMYVASNELLPWMKNISIEPRDFVKAARDFLRRRAAGELPGSEKPPSAPAIEELAKIKTYLDSGGTLFAVNEGASKVFADSVEKMGMLLYPQYDWRALPEDHWAYTIHDAVTSHRPPLRALSNGVRELIILSPTGDLPAILQKNDDRQRMDFETAGNIYFYASELNRPHLRLEHATTSDRFPAPGMQQCVIVRALHEGNWKPEPLALETFADHLLRSRHIQAQINDAPLSKIANLSTAPALVIVNGIEKHEFTSAEIDAIQRYLGNGGVICFETPGGRGDFAASAEETAASEFGKSAQSALRTRVITGEGLTGAVDLTQVQYRPYSLEAFGTRETAPRLRCMILDEARGPQLFFSREDISNALLDQPCWGISGYAPQSAFDLLANLVQHAIAMRESIR